MKPDDQLETTIRQRTELARLLSGVRMHAYESTPTPGEACDPLDVYVYNMALAGALLGPLHILEVVVRNAMHAQLAAHAGRDDWWDAPRVTLVTRQLQEITAAEIQFRDGRSAGSLPATPDDIVAALDFGFWCGLLGRGSAAEGAHYERDLWQPALRLAFPNYRGTRSNLARSLNAMRTVRNRISHHEPIHALDQRTIFVTTIRLINCVSTDVAHWVDDRSRVPLIVAGAPGTTAPIRYF